MIDGSSSAAFCCLAPGMPNVTYLMRGKITPCGYLLVLFIFQGERCHTLKGSPHFTRFFGGNSFGIELCCNKHTCWCLLYLTWSWWNQNALNRLMTRAGRTIKATVRLNHQSVFVFRCRSIATRTSEAKPIYNLESVHKGSPNFLGSHAFQLKT